MPVKDTRVRRIALSALGLVLVAAAGWLLAMPGARIDAAQADIAGTAMLRPALRTGSVRLGGIPLETLLNAEKRLDSAEVRGARDETVGEVYDVVVGRGGRPRIVRVAFGGFFGFGEKIVPLPADRLAYDPRHNVVLTDMDEGELEAFAARHPTREARAD
jgi:hypothetical protein